MTLLYNVLFAWKCTSTHHKLAMDALRHLRCPDASYWLDLFLFDIEAYLDGAKAPDNKFKDFRNHVLHVRDNYWGGATTAARNWYRRTVDALRQQQWPEAVYCAGVLSHYFTDPFMPFHTGQTEEEGNVHRALEWSITKSYDEMQQLLEAELGGYPVVDRPASDDWLEQMIRQGAEAANPHYELLLEHYDLAKGVADPPAGLDQPIRTEIARLLGRASVGFARVLDRAIEEAAVTPPSVNVTLLGVLAGLTIPIFWITKKLADDKERAIVEAMYKEYMERGKVLETLPEDDRTIRRLHAQEVSQTPLADLDARKPRTIGTQHAALEITPEIDWKPLPELEPASQPAQPAAAIAEPEPMIFTLPSSPIETAERRFYLSPEMPVVDAPSIGPKTADRLKRAGVHTVADLLACDPKLVAEKIGVRHILPETIRDWQAQARLACRVPGLRGHDAQFLVACGILEPEQLRLIRPEELLSKVEAFLATPEGERVLRSGKRPDLQEVRSWIEWAGQARTLKAA